MPDALHVPFERKSPQAIVYGLGPSGSGGTYWNAVAALLPEQIEIRALRLPGRETRLKEPPHRTAPPAVEEITGVIAADLRHGLPALLVGSCSGALLLRCALAGLEKAPNPPSALVVLRQPPPALITPDAEDPSGFDRERLRRWLREQGDTADLVLDHDRMFALVEPAVRADLEMDASYAAMRPPRLSTPVVTLSSTSDGPQDAWQRETTAAHTDTRFAVDRVTDQCVADELQRLAVRAMTIAAGPAYGERP